MSQKRMSEGHEPICTVFFPSVMTTLRKHAVFSLRTEWIWNHQDFIRGLGPVAGGMDPDGNLTYYKWRPLE